MSIPLENRKRHHMPCVLYWIAGQFGLDTTSTKRHRMQIYKVMASNNVMKKKKRKRAEILTKQNIYEAQFITLDILLNEITIQQSNQPSAWRSLTII